MRVKLSDLQPGTNYALQLQTNTGDAVSEWSRAFYLLTDSDTVAPKTPTGVAGSMSGTSFQLNWDAVIESADNSPAHDLDHYEVKVESAGTGTNGVFLVNDTKFLFDLSMNRQLFGSPRANVKMSVRAVDKVGNASAYSSVVDQTNPAPANPTNFSATSIPDGISLKWDAVADTDLFGYKVYEGTSSGSQTTLVWQGDATSANIPSTAYFTDKWYKVAAVDVFGTESASPPVAGPVKPASPFTVDTTAPDTPTGLAATLTTADDTTTSAAVSWTAVADPDGDLAGYRIGYRPVGASDWQYTDVDYTLTSTRIDRLTPYVEYQFRIRAYDFAANYSAWSSTVTTTSAAVNTAPSTPAAPSVTADTLKIQVSHSNTKAVGGAMEPDVAYYEVYASVTNGFTASSSNMLGTMPVGPAIIGTFSVPAYGGGASQTWYVRVIAVDRLGLKSSQSSQATSNPNLISAIHIVDATITDAKIANLAANKIIAGTGFVNDLTVKSKFTLGDASTDGIIESYDYGTSSGATGFRLAKSGLIIKTGQIEAAALKIQDSDNIIPPAYAAFEFTPSFYSGKLTTSGATNTIVTSGGRFGAQYLQSRSTAAATFAVSIGGTSTDYNMQLEPSTTYIVSAWMKTGSVASSVGFRIRQNIGYTANFGTTTLPASGSWQRVSGTITTGALATSGLLVIDCNTATIGAGFDIDGIQVERQVAGSTTPSPWTPPGLTSVDGGIIRTGEIRSTSTIDVAGVSLPAWSINTQGNMQVGDALVRGRLVVGALDEDYPNRAPNGGDFEINDLTGYALYETGITGGSISRTTTGGEVISGTASLKITSSAGSKTGLGVDVTIPTAPAGTTVTASFKIKSDGTGGAGYRAYFFDSANPTTGDIVILQNPMTAGTVYTLSTAFLVPSGKVVDRVRIYHGGGTITTTSMIVDDISVTMDNEIGHSFVQSANYSRGVTGWRIDGAGNAEFNSGTFRGSVVIGKPTAISAPTLTMSSQTTYFTGASATYYYKITGYNVGGETTGSNEVSMVVTNGGDSPYLSWPALPLGLNGVKVYRGTAAGAENRLIATIVGSAASGYLDDGSVAGTVASPPGASTIANSSQVVNIDTSGLYAGATSYAAAPFTIDLAGNLTAATGTITGYHFQTAKSGKKISLGASAFDWDGIGNEMIRFDTGISNTTPGFIRSYLRESVAHPGQYNSSFEIQAPNGAIALGLYGPNYDSINPQSMVQLNADSGRVGPLSWSADASGTPTIDNGLVVLGKLESAPQQYTLTLGSGWAAYGAPFSAPRAFKQPDGSWVMTGLFRRSGADVSITTTGVTLGTIPASSYTAAGRAISPTVANSANIANLCVQIDEGGVLLLRIASGAAQNFPTGAWISISGITFHSAQS